jgi:hypothetical protein
VLVGVLIVIGIGCQKEASNAAVKNEEEFNAAVVKEWYYGTFKKMPEWAGYNSVANKMKLPDWKKGIYIKMGDKEIVEFPFVKEKSVVPITYKSNLSESEKRQIANAAISRVLFIKQKSGNIIVREMQYIPDMDYLEKHNFDISQNMIGKTDNDFSGTIVVKKWNGQETSKNILENGKIIGRIKIQRNNGRSSQMNRTQACPVGSTQVDEYARDCESHLYGDGMATYDCGEWYPTGNQWCIDDEDIDNNPGGCSDPSSQECFCELIGGCYEDPNGGGGEEINCANVQGSLEGTSVSEIESSTTENETPTTRDRKYNWVIFKQNWNLFKFVSHEKGVHIKVNNVWKWESLTHNTITRTGGIIGGSVACSLIDATPTLGLYNASMTLDYHIEANAICKGSPLSFGNDFTSTLYRNVND